MGELWRNLISRAVLLALGMALMFGGYRCLVKAGELRREDLARNQRITYRHGERRPPSGFVLVGAIGLALAGVGMLCAFGALAPTALIERVLHPRAPRTFENPEPGIPPHTF